MQIVKVFIPQSILNPKTLSTRLRGDVNQQSNGATSFYIVDSNAFSCIGSVDEIVNNTMNTKPRNFVRFTKFQSEQDITLHSLHIDNQQINPTHIQLYLYNADDVARLNVTEACCAQKDLLYLTKLVQGSICSQQHTSNSLILLLTKLKMLLSIFPAVSSHFHYWLLKMDEYSFQNGKIWTIILDMIAGVALMAFLLHLGDPGQYLMILTNFVVDNLRYLLNSLEGSPVGLKLNVQLNNFLLKCFSYHVDLWATFLIIVSPAFAYFAVPLAVIGCLGLSFQLALLSDLLVLISLHAHCFYIYAALLYHTEIVGIQTLWRVVLGKRKNILKGRVESHDYMNRQLYLATMFFAALLFLLPTILVYYVVFASLRFCVYTVTYVLWAVQKNILRIPARDIVLWFCGQHIRIDKFRLVCIEGKITTLKVKFINASPFSRLRESCIDDGPNERYTIKQFVSALIKGELLGFIQPKQSEFNK